MTTSDEAGPAADERLKAVDERIDDAKEAARTLADHDVIDPDPVEGPERDDVKDYDV